MLSALVVAVATLIVLPLLIEVFAEDVRVAIARRLAKRVPLAGTDASDADASGVSEGAPHARGSQGSAYVSTSPLPTSYSAKNAWPGPSSALPPELEAVRGQTWGTWRAVRRLQRRDAADLRVPRRLHRVTAATRSSSRIARLWLPMAVGASTLTLEIPLLLLVAVHVHDDGTTLTGFALALAIIIAIDAGPLALTTTSASSATRGWPPRAMWRYALAAGAVSCLMLAVVWSDVLGNPLGFADPTWDATRDVLRALMIAPLLVAVRRHFHGRLLYAKKTGWVVWATVARALTSFGLAIAFSLALDAGATGLGLALTAGVAVEASIVAYAGAGGGERAPARWSDMLKIARIHLPLSGSTLLAVVPVAAVLGGLALSDGSDQTLAAWFVVFIGPSLIANVTLDIEAITATNPEGPGTGTLAFAVALGIVLTALWVGLASNAGIGDDVVTCLAPFPLLCVAREWLRGRLIARDCAPCTIPAVCAGSVALVVAFLVERSAGLEPVTAVALAISIGAAAETVLLRLFSRRRASRRDSRAARSRVESAGDLAG